MDSQADQQQGVCVLGAGEVAGMSLLVELQRDGSGVVLKMGRSLDKLKIITPVSVFYLLSASPTGRLLRPGCSHLLFPLRFLKAVYICSNLISHPLAPQY